MNFDCQIQNKIELLNEILAELNESILFENLDFSIGELSAEFYLELKLHNSYKNTIPMEIRISQDGFQIGLDRVSEVYEWSNDFIEKSNNVVKTLIRQLFTSSIEVEYCGTNYTCFNIFDKNGELLFSTPVISGFYLKYKCQKKTYSPIYP